MGDGSFGSSSTGCGVKRLVRIRRRELIEADRILQNAESVVKQQMPPVPIR
jgi:hypothetical protein